MKTIRKLLLLCLFGMISMGAWAYDFSAINEDGAEIYYNIISGTSSKTVEVTYKTKYEGDTYSKAINIPNSVSKDGVTYAVVGIGDCAFWNCSGLTSITVPNSVTSIGYSVFYNCNYEV